MAGVPLNVFEREEIRAGLEREESFVEIARGLDRDPSTVSREVARNGRRHRYVAARAQLHTDKRRCRPKTPRLIADLELAAVVQRDLKAGFSPGAICARLRAAGGTALVPETIYQALYSKTFRGLSVMPAVCLRTRRRQRRSRTRPEKPGWRGQVKLIDERPRAALDRVEAGHWEGDLIVGSRSRSAIVTLIERVSRYTLLARLPRGHDSKEVIAALIGSFEGLPSSMRRSLTWDQGGELAYWADLETVLDLPVYFCHPHSPWERPSNENLNRQLRYWFPKGTDLSIHDQNALDRATNVLNNQPRRLLDWETSAQRYGQLAVR